MTYDSKPVLYCDHCGAQTDTEKMYHYERLPWDIDSANAGESGSVCELCQHNLEEARVS